VSRAYPVWDRETALTLASFAHRGQVDKGGEDYLGHPLRVAQKTEAKALRRRWASDDIETAVMVALLHDVPEDTKVTVRMLLALGCPGRVVRPVELLTRTSEVSTERYYEQIRQDTIALLVKECDIEHNLSEDRLSVLGHDTQARLRSKYAKAQVALGLVSP
jgi:(p)ppGpp synthase/HD superfamily hydrolase